jgi:hypothetical protein
MYWINPLVDPRWAQLEQHPQASLFHNVSWLEALHRTYRYRPVALTSCQPGVELSDGIPFCEVKSWISGSRLVSLPFSDHCHPLVTSADELPSFISYLVEHCAQLNWKYIELRPVELLGTLAVARARGEELTKNITFTRSTCDPICPRSLIVSIKTASKERFSVLGAKISNTKWDDRTPT